MNKKTIVNMIEKELENNYKKTKKVNIRSVFNSDFSNLFKMFEMKTRYEKFREDFFKTPVNINILKKFNALFGYEALTYILIENERVEILYEDLLRFMSLHSAENIIIPESENSQKYLILVKKIGV